MILSELPIKYTMFSEREILILSDAVLGDAVQMTTMMPIFSSPVGSLCHTRGIVRRPTYVVCVHHKAVYFLLIV